VPGVERQPLKKLAIEDSTLLKLLHRWREEAEKAGRKIERIAVAFEAGRDGFWLASFCRKIIKTGRSRYSCADELGISARPSNGFVALFPRIFWVYARRDDWWHRWARVCERRFCRRGADLPTKLFVGSFGSARCAFDQQLGDLHEIVGEHRGANQQFESLGALGEATLHAAAAH
jgi:hypothetical protein